MRRQARAGIGVWALFVASVSPAALTLVEDGKPAVVVICEEGDRPAAEEALAC